MRAEKKYISAEYLEKLNASPYLIAVDYQGLKVDQFAELRARLAEASAEMHVVQNRIFSVALKESGIEQDIKDQLKGQLAIITGEKEISAAAKAAKNFQAEFDRPVIRFGFMGDLFLSDEQVKQIAELPSLDVLRGKIVGMIASPATKLATLIQTPGTQLAQVIKAKAEKGE